MKKVVVLNEGLMALPTLPAHWRAVAPETSVTETHATLALFEGFCEATWKQVCALPGHAIVVAPEALAPRFHYAVLAGQTTFVSRESGLAWVPALLNLLAPPSARPAPAPEVAELPVAQVA